MPDPWNAAWAEAEATAPPGVAPYFTIELFHDAFVESGVPFSIRAVALVVEDVTLTLEPGAPLDGGTAVVFKAIPFRAERPEIAEGRVPECRITVDNVAGEMMPYLEAAVLLRSDMKLIYREYLPSDTSEPAYGPVEFMVKKVNIQGASLQGSARLRDLANRKFSSKIYTTREYPGLLA